MGAQASRVPAEGSRGLCTEGYLGGSRFPGDTNVSGPECKVCAGTCSGPHSTPVKAALLWSESSGLHGNDG